MPLDTRRKMIDRQESPISICHQCELPGVARSSLYYTPSKASNKDLQLMEMLDKLYLEDPTRGTRRMSHELQKKGHKVGRCHVRSLMQIMRLKTVYCRPRTTIIDPSRYKYPYLLRNLEMQKPNHVWSLDISYIPMVRGYMYLLAIMDVYSRCILGWSLSNTMEAEWVVNTLRMTVNKYGRPEIINPDQGSQFTPDEYVDYLKALKPSVYLWIEKVEPLITSTSSVSSERLNTRKYILRGQRREMNYTISVHSLFSITMKGAIILQSGIIHHSLYIRELHNLLTKN